MTMSLSQLDELLYPIFDESYKSVKCYYTAMSPVSDELFVFICQWFSISFGSGVGCT